jgi:hypothetical protein
MTRLERFTQVAEIVASVGVIITLVILVQEVRTNTIVVEEQSRAQMMAALTGPFLNPDVLPGLYAKVKSVDSLAVDQAVVAFEDRYGMTTEEAVQWTRLLWLQWSQWEALFAREGPSEDLATIIRFTMTAPDVELFVRSWVLPSGGPFAEYVSRITAQQ